MFYGRLSLRGLFASLVFLAPAMTSAQHVIRMHKNELNRPVDSAEINSVIDQALSHLKSDYVFPELAAKMIEAVRHRQQNNEYANIKTAQDLADRLTHDLQAVSQDKHLRIVSSNGEFRKHLKGPAGDPTPQMKAEMQRVDRWLNGHVRKVERLGGNVGYLAVDGFPSAEGMAEAAAAAMNFLANTDALIIDLRHNGGGSPEGVALLCSYFFDSKPVLINRMYWRKDNRTDEFWTRKEVAGPRYLGKDVYVLIGPRTFSGGEEFAYDLQTQKRAVLVGQTTGGGAHPGGMTPLGDHFAMFVPAGRAINPITNTDWEGTGVKPDIAVPADQALEKSHDLAIQRLLEKTKDDRHREMIQMDAERSRDLQAGKMGPMSK
jgi:retinol-binding protein 3